MGFGLSGNREINMMMMTMINERKKQIVWMFPRCTDQPWMTLGDIVRSFKSMMIGVGVTDLPEGCVPGGLYAVFSTDQMKLVADYLFIRYVTTGDAKEPQPGKNEPSQNPGFAKNRTQTRK